MNYFVNTMLSPSERYNLDIARENRKEQLNMSNILNREYDDNSLYLKDKRE